MLPQFLPPSTSQPVEPVSRTMQILYNKYSSSQTYYYSNHMNEIIKQKRSKQNILYEDIEYLCDDDQYLKRPYAASEYQNKMFTFKEYYYYHEDCPRVFIKGIDEVYSKWQDKKRDIIYKKLKLIYNESYTASEDNSNEQHKGPDPAAITHFLMDISDYNPYSKKYYLRVEAKKELTKKQIEKHNQQKSNVDLQNLNHELSGMLNDIHNLSQISTLLEQDANTPRKDKPFRKSKNVSHSREGSSAEFSHSKSRSLIKLNFKKNKPTLEDRPDPIKKEEKKHEKRDSKERKPEIARKSPKFETIHDQNELLRTKSIFTVSSFAVINKKSEQPQIQGSKRDILKINLRDKKIDHKELILTKEAKRSLRKEPSQQYNTEKKPSARNNIIIKTKSTSKILQQNSVEKLKKREVREISIVKLQSLKHEDAFSDKKISRGLQNKLRSHNSEYSATSKNILKLKPVESKKRGLQINNL